MGYLPDQDLLQRGALTKEGGSVERVSPLLSPPGQTGIETWEPGDSSSSGLFGGEQGAESGESAAERFVLMTARNTKHKRDE